MELLTKRTHTHNCSTNPSSRVSNCIKGSTEHRKNTLLSILTDLHSTAMQSFREKMNYATPLRLFRKAISTFFVQSQALNLPPSEILIGPRTHSPLLCDRLRPIRGSSKLQGTNSDTAATGPTRPRAMASLESIWRENCFDTVR